MQKPNTRPTCGFEPVFNHLRKVRDDEGLLDFVVTYYEKEDEWMDTPLIFCCSAEDEDHAVEQCHDAYPGCTTTYVEDIER